MSTNRKAAIPRESALDRKNEEEIITEVTTEWMCESTKIPKKYSLDYALTRNSVIIAYVEAKDRSKKWRDYKTYMLSLYKYNRAQSLATAQGKPCYLVARLKDSIMWTLLNELPHDITKNTQIGGWSEPRDSDDIEPVVFIPIKYFRELKGSGGAKGELPMLHEPAFEVVEEETS